jgi:2-keto-4-pentenoate hydratase/2-oxohepta-3-ene-1,7-dioic acid hydratase in catechol pathway
VKLIRYRDNGKVKPGVIINEQYFDVSSFINEYDENFFADDVLNKLKGYLDTNNNQLKHIEGEISLDCPVARPSKIICIGLNYRDHATETNAAIPAEPIVFFKSTTAIIGPNDNVVIPKDSQKTDWEVELAVVVGKKASYIKEDEASDYIAGYCLHNDLSERAFQLERGGQWVKGKSADTFAPLGPYLVTTDELQNVDSLRMWLKVNGEVMQDGSTADLIFKVPYLISYLSQFMTLLPGDIISTGTPAGVGLGRKPPLYLKAGDVMESGIDGLGDAKQHVTAYSNNR